MNFPMKKTIASLLAVALALPSWAAIPVSNYTWNAASDLVSAQEGSGATTQYGYNEHGELTQETWPAGFGGLTYGRNGQGALTSVQDPRGLVTSYVRNGFAEVSQQTSPDTGTESYSLDGAGNVTSKALPTGGSVSFSYDAANRITSANSGDESATYSYDAGSFGKGRLTSLQDSSGNTTWTYDGAGNVLSKTQTAGGVSLAVGYGYSSGRLSQITYPSGAVVSFGFDAERVTSISVNGVPAITGVDYAPFGPATSWQMAGAGTYARAFDTAGRVVSYTYENGTRQLDWDASNRLTSVQHPDGSTWTYGYDDLNRIVSANEGTQGTHAFGLDAVGNRTSLTKDGTAYSYAVEGSSNRLTSAAGPGQAQSFQYDAAGRVTTDGSRVYTWTNAGRLATATAGTTSAAYAYNGFGQRVQKTVGAGVRQYLFAEDGTSLLGEYSVQGGNASSLVEVVYLGSTPVLALAGGQVYSIQADHLNAPRTIKNSTGAVVWRWQSDAFGVGQADSNPSGLFEFEFNLRFPGQLFDTETGLHYNNARYYDPATGRYISSDPIGLAGGINSYGYVGQAPTGAVDPSGQVIDTLADAAFLVYDVYRLAADNIFGTCENLGENLTALGADAAAFFIPGVTGGGLAVRATGHAVEGAIDLEKLYARPTHFRKNVRDEVWNASKGADGQVLDPSSHAIMSKNEPWDMGHKPGFEFRKHQKSAKDRGISRKQFLDEHNNPDHYRPELPKGNRSHAGEDMSDNYFGP